jgi:sugar phosphate permease
VNKRALAISLFLSASSVGGFIAPTLLNRVIEAFHGNWRAGWWLVAALCAVSALLAIFFVKENPADIGQYPDGKPAVELVDASVDSASRTARGVYKTQQEWTYGQVLRTPAWWVLLIAPVGFSIGWFFFLAHGVIHLRDLGYSPTQAAHSMSVLLFLGLVGTLLVAFLGDRIEPRLLLAGAVLSFGVGMMLVLNAKGTAGIYTYAAFLGIGFGSAVPSTMTIISNYFGTKPYASLVGFSMAFGTTLGAFASWGGGFLYDHFGSYSGAFYAISILCMIGFLILLFLRPPVRKALRIPSMDSEGFVQERT